MFINIININEDGGPISLEVDSGTEIGTLKSLIEVELNIPILRQKLTFPGQDKVLNDSDTLGGLGVQEQDVIAVEDKVQMSTPAEVASGSPSGAFRGLLDLQVQQILASARNPQIMAQLEQKNPSLADAVKRQDLDAIREEVRKGWDRFSPGATRMMSVDPLSAEGQQMMMDQIRQEQIDQNRSAACEYLPESFGDVVMLYIKVEVNNVPIMAFVDSGAQSTIMSEECARKCNLERIIDRRYRGMAMGIGRAKLVGRIHMAQINCAGVFFPASFTIIENQQMDLLFGLDLLRRHQCNIDLRHNVLRFGEVAVPFLSEADIRANHNEAMLEGLTGASPGTFDETPTDQPANAPAAAATRPNQGRLQIDEQKVQQLMTLGFDRNRVVESLRRCNGDTELAASILFQSTGGGPF